MGLGLNNIRLLTLTRLKASRELNMTIASNQKWALTREMSTLSQEYNSRLKNKQLAFYANGQYNNLSYSYLMGYGALTDSITSEDSVKYPCKTDNSMILADYNGRVVLSSDYANAIIKALGPSVMNEKGIGGTFSTDKIAEIISNLVGSANENEIQTVIDEGKIPSITKNNGQATLEYSINSTVEAFVDFYYPIFVAAATNGWTTQYNKDMQLNDNYISDAVVTGTFQLITVNGDGSYDETGSLNYFLISGQVIEKQTTEVREEITAWFEAEKALIAEKETLIDITMNDLSTELESIKAEIQSVQSLLDDAINSVFDWGSA